MASELPKLNPCRFCKHHNAVIQTVSRHGRIDRLWYVQCTGSGCMNGLSGDSPESACRAWNEANPIGVQS